MTLLLNQCCCGCSLRTGTIIIAVYMLTTSVLVTIFASVVLGTSSEVPADHYYNENTVEYYDNLHRNLRHDPGFRMTLISAIAGAAIKSVLNSVLLIGVSKERRNLVLSWLVAYTIVVGLCVLVFVASFFQFPTNPIFQASIFVSIVLYIYFLLVVRSYHHNMPDGHQRQLNAAMMFGGEETNIKPMRLK